MAYCNRCKSNTPDGAYCTFCGSKIVNKVIDYETTGVLLKSNLNLSVSQDDSKVLRSDNAKMVDELEVETGLEPQPLAEEEVMTKIIREIPSDFYTPSVPTTEIDPMFGAPPAFDEESINRQF